MSKGGARLLDGSIAIGCAAAMGRLQAIDSLSVLLVAMTGVLFLAGALSGRYRIVLWAFIASFLIGRLFRDCGGDDCDRGLSDLSSELQVLTVLGLFAGQIVALALGVALRRRWRPDENETAAMTLRGSLYWLFGLLAVFWGATFLAVLVAIGIGSSLWPVGLIAGALLGIFVLYLFQPESDQPAG